MIYLTQLGSWSQSRDIAEQNKKNKKEKTKIKSGNKTKSHPFTMQLTHQHIRYNYAVLMSISLLSKQRDFPRFVVLGDNGICGMVQSVVELPCLLWLSKPIVERQALLHLLQVKVASGSVEGTDAFCCLCTLLSSHFCSVFSLLLWMAADQPT